MHFLFKQVKLHSQDSVPDMTTAHSVSPGHETILWVNQINYERLNEPYGKCYPGKRLPHDRKFVYEYFITLVQSNE